MDKRCFEGLSERVVEALLVQGQVEIHILQSCHRISSKGLAAAVECLAHSVCGCFDHRGGHVGSGQNADQTTNCSYELSC